MLQTHPYIKNVYINTQNRILWKHHDDAFWLQTGHSTRKIKSRKKQVKDNKINTADGGGACISKQTITHKYR